MHAHAESSIRRARKLETTWLPSYNVPAIIAPVGDGTPLDRLTTLATERDRELEAIAARYRQQDPHRFPVAVVFVAPKRETTR